MRKYYQKNTQLNENKSKQIIVITFDGKKIKYNNNDINEFIHNLDLTAEDLPGMIYRASMGNPNIIGTRAKSYNKKKEAIMDLLKKIRLHDGDVIINIDSKNPSYKHNITFESINESTKQERYQNTKNLRSEVRRIVREELNRNVGYRDTLSENDGVSLQTKLLNPDKFVITKNDLIVNGNLNLNDTPIRSLPTGLNVSGYLQLRGSQIQSLPYGLKVGKYLDLRDTQIQSLPADLKVGSTLFLSGTRIRSLPNSLKNVESLDLSNTKITSLPVRFKVNGYLDLTNCTLLKELPDGLKIGTWLGLDYTSLQSLPNGLQVDRALFLRGTPVVKNIYNQTIVKKMIKDKGGYVKGKIYVN